MNDQTRADICVIGLGYIGLPTASVFATQGFSVVGVDINSQVVSTVNEGDIHIEEPGLRTMVQAGVKSGQLRASTQVEPADVYIIAVPTPCTYESEDKRSSDLGAVRAATQAMLQVIEPGSLVILESTSPPGTTENIVARELEEKGFAIGEDVFVAHCPERVLPGHIMRELTQNDRVIGGITEEGSRRATELYASFVEGDIHQTDATTAELVKLMENTFRDVNIALANELADICDHLDVDVTRVVDLANCHPRVHLHKPGPGVGGHCLPIDPWFVIESAPEQAKLIREARLINQRTPARLLESVLQTIEASDPSIALFGLAYKGDVDDARESPGLEFAEICRERAIKCRVYDPHVKSASVELSGLETAVEGADALVITSAHAEYKYIDPVEIRKLMGRPYVFDFCNLLNRDKWLGAGFEYVGRGVR